MCVLRNLPRIILRLETASVGDALHTGKIRTSCTLGKPKLFYHRAGILFPSLMTKKNCNRTAWQIHWIVICPDFLVPDTWLPYFPNCHDTGVHVLSQCSVSTGYPCVVFTCVHVLFQFSLSTNHPCDLPHSQCVVSTCVHVLSQCAVLSQCVMSALPMCSGHLSPVSALHRQPAHEKL